MNYQLTINSPIGDDILYGLSPDLTIAGITVVQPGRAFPYEDADETIPIAPGKTYRVFYRTFDEDWTEANSQTITVPGNILINTGGTSEAVHLTITEPVGPGYTYGLSATGTIAGISVQQDDPTFFFSDSFGTPLLTGQTYRVFYKEYGGAWSLDNSVLIALSDQIGVDGEQIVASVIALTDVPLENTVTELAHFRTRTLPDGRTVRELVYTPLTDGETDIDLIPGEVDDFEQIYEDEKSLWLTNPEQNGFGGIPLGDKLQGSVPLDIFFDSINNPTQKRCYRIGRLPNFADLGNRAHIQFWGVLGGLSSGEQTLVSGFVANRDADDYEYSLFNLGPAQVALVARRMLDGQTDFYLRFGAAFGKARLYFGIHQAFHDTNYTPFDEIGEGTITLDTNRPDDFPPSMWVQGGQLRVNSLRLRNALPEALLGDSLLALSGGEPRSVSSAALRERVKPLSNIWSYPIGGTFRPARYRQIYRATAPGGGGTNAYDLAKITVYGGASEPGRKALMVLHVTNNNPLAVEWSVWGESPANCPLAVVAYREPSGIVAFYLHYRTDDYVTSLHLVDSSVGVVDYNQSEVLTPIGTLVFNTAEPATYPPSLHIGLTEITTEKNLTVGKKIKTKDLELENLPPAGSDFLIPVYSPIRKRFEGATTEQILDRLNVTPDTGAPSWPAIEGVTMQVGVGFTRNIGTPIYFGGGGGSVVSSGLPAGITYNATTGLLAGTPTTAGDSTVQLAATDAVNGKVGTATFSAKVNPAAATTMAFLAPGYNPSTGALTLNVSNPNPSKVVEYRAVGLFDWQESPNATIPEHQRNGTTFTFEARYKIDGTNYITQRFTTSTVSTGNLPPIVNGTIPAQTTRVGIAFSYDLPVNLFSDPNAGDVLTYSAFGLPAGFSITPATGRISGTGTLAVANQLVVIRATDSAGAQEQTSFLFTVSPSSSIVQLTPAYNAGTFELTLNHTGALAGYTVERRIREVSLEWRTVDNPTFFIPSTLRTAKLTTEVRQVIDGVEFISSGEWIPGGTLTIQKRYFFTSTPPAPASGLDPEPPTPAVSSGWIVGQYLLSLSGITAPAQPEIQFRYEGEAGVWRNMNTFGSAYRLSATPGTNLTTLLPLQVRVRIAGVLPETLIDTFNSVSGGGAYSTALSTTTGASFTLIDADSNEIIETGRTNS